MDLDFQGIPIVVVGASNGLGLAATQLLLAEGARVIGVARRDIDLGVAHGSELVSVKADMSTVEGESRLRETLSSEGMLGGVLCAVGNGTATSGSLLERFASAHDRNLVPTLRALDACEPFLAKDERSAVVLTTSVAGVEYIECPPEYAATKSSIAAYSAHLARAWAPVRVNVLAPGNMMSAGSVWERRAGENSQGLQDYLEANVPLRRIASPMEVARMAVILLSPVASFVTGSILVADGGQSRSW